MSAHHRNLACGLERIQIIKGEVCNSRIPPRNIKPAGIGIRVYVIPAARPADLYVFHYLVRAGFRRLRQGSGNHDSGAKTKYEKNVSHVDHLLWTCTLDFGVKYYLQPC